MPQFLSSALVVGGVAFGLTLFGARLYACGGDDDTSPLAAEDASTQGRRDSGSLVEPTEAGAPLDGGVGDTPSCDKYCSLVMANCTGANEQYASMDECLAFCGHLPLTQPSRSADEKEAASVACRQYWADSPARTSPDKVCLAAGPFGGNVCGDRCTAFCEVVLDTCTPSNGGTPAYSTLPECASDCANFSYRDAGVDGGGEGPSNPGSNDTLNCRLFQLRAAVLTPSKCSTLHPDGGACEGKK